MKPDCSPLDLAESLSEYWSPKVIAQLDNYYIKVAKLKNELIWHTHEEEDELFMVLKGHLTMEYADKKVELKTGDLHVVPKGKHHNPVARNECLVMVIEHKKTTHTGSTIISNGRSIEEQLSYMEPFGT